MSEVRCWEHTVPKWEFVCVIMFLSHCFETFCRFRKRNSVVGSLSSLISKQSNLQEGKWTSVLPATCDWRVSWRFLSQNDDHKGVIVLCCVCVFVEEMHAEVCYAECLLQKATLTFVQVTTFPVS